MKKTLILLTLLFIMIVSGTFGANLMRVMAVEEEHTHYNKYYTSIRLEEGDSLWTIAERYDVNSGKSREEYVRELRRMNSLTDDTIHAGNYLTVSYYQAGE